MSNIGKSIVHLVRGNYLRRINNAVNSSENMLLTLSENGSVLRTNLVQNLCAELNTKTNVNSELNPTDGEFTSTLQKALIPAVAKATGGREDDVLHWHRTNSKFTLLNVPRNVVSDDLLIDVNQSKVDVNNDAEPCSGAEKDALGQNFFINVTTNEKSQPLTSCIYTLIPLISKQGKWSIAYQDFLRSRRKWWKKYFFNPAAVEVAEMDPRTEIPRATIQAKFDEQNFDLSNNLTLETIRMLDKNEIPNIPCDITAGNADTSVDSTTEEFKIVESRCSLSEGAVALLLDSVRKRLYLNSTRIALHQDLTPHQVGICCADAVCSEEQKENMTKLKQYLMLLLRNKSVRVFGPDKKEGNFFNEYEAADAYGVPYLIVITAESLKDGIVNIRDREVRECFTFNFPI